MPQRAGGLSRPLGLTGSSLDTLFPEDAEQHHLPTRARHCTNSLWLPMLHTPWQSFPGFPFSLPTSPPSCASCQHFLKVWFIFSSSPPHNSGARAGRAGGCVFQEVTSPKGPVIGRSPTMRAPMPAVAVPMRTRETELPQGSRSRKKENLLPPRRKRPNSPAKPLLNYPLVV